MPAAAIIGDHEGHNQRAECGRKPNLLRYHVLKLFNES
jgi:hypothetical protein